MRLIDADALIQRLQKDPLFELVEQYGLTSVIEAQPAVVRCKDCKYCSVDRHSDGNVPDYVCIEMDCGVEADGFCAWGERREDADK